MTTFKVNAEWDEEGAGPFITLHIEDHARSAGREGWIGLSLSGSLSPRKAHELASLLHEAADAEVGSWRGWKQVTGLGIKS